MPQIIESLVDGGKASSGPPLGPALGPTGINVKEVVEVINQKTKDFAGVKIPVKIIIDPATKKFEVEIGTPPASALIKKELGLEKGGKDKQIVGNLTIDQLIKVVGMKRSKLLAGDLKASAKEIAGTCVSMGISIEGLEPKQFIKAVEEGQFDDKLK